MFGTVVLLDLIYVNFVGQDHGSITSWLGLGLGLGLRCTFAAAGGLYRMRLNYSVAVVTI